MKKLSVLVCLVLLMSALFCAVSAEEKGFLLEDCEESGKDAAVFGVEDGIGWSMKMTGIPCIADDDTNAVVGDGCFALDCAVGIYVQAGETFNEPKNSGMTDVETAALDFWLYIDKAEKLEKSLEGESPTAPYIALMSNGGKPFDVVDGSGYRKMPLNGLQLADGKWNHVVLPLKTGSLSPKITNDVDLSALSGFELFVKLNSEDAGYMNAVVRMDELRLIPYAEGDASGVIGTVDVGQKYTGEATAPSTEQSTKSSDNSAAPSAEATNGGAENDGGNGLTVGLVVAALVVVVVIVIVAVLLGKKKKA